MGFRGRNGVQPGLGGRQAGALDHVGVEIAPVHVPDFSLRTPRRSALGQALHDASKVDSGVLIECREAAPARPVRRNGGCVEPVSVGEAIEVVAGLHRRIVRGQIQTEVTELRVTFGGKFGLSVRTSHQGAGHKRANRHPEHH